VFGVEPECFGVEGFFGRGKQVLPCASPRVGMTTVDPVDSLKFTTAFERLMPSSENASTSSWRLICSRSFFGDQPRQAEKINEGFG